MAASLDEQTTSPSFQPGQVVDFSAFPRPMSNPPFASSQPPPPLPAAHQQSLGFPPPKGPPLSRGPSPLSPLQGSDWSPWSPPPPSTATPSFPQPFAPALSPSHQHRPSLSSSFANLTLDPGAPSPRASPPAPSVPRDGPPALTAPLPTVAILSVQQVAIQQPNADPARRIAWCKDVLALVDRAQQLLARTDSNSTDPTVGPAQINDPELQQLVNVAIPIILQVSSQAQQGPIPPYVAEAIYMRATCAATGIYPQFIPHDPRTAFRDFERAAKAGYHAAWFKLGREYENFNDVQHAKECFERGMRHGVETCYYRLGMAHLMGQLGFQPDPKAALPLLHRAATLATIEVPQPAYVYGLLLLNEFSHVSIPSHLFQPFLPPGVTLQEEARKHLERAAYTDEEDIIGSASVGDDLSDTDAHEISRAATEAIVMPVLKATRAFKLEQEAPTISIGKKLTSTCRDNTGSEGTDDVSWLSRTDITSGFKQLSRNSWTITIGDLAEPMAGVIRRAIQLTELHLVFSIPGHLLSAEPPYTPFQLDGLAQYSIDALILAAEEMGFNEESDIAHHLEAGSQTRYINPLSS
ncbi:hypothetical protein BD414DRAFT_541115 [Trametes punicea]|nr:hypothetical protein BD414DRAFT_541115 [Trametes punicea]